VILNSVAIVYAIISALLYAIYTPAAKILGISCPPAYLTAYLYLGSGIGLGILYLLFKKQFEHNEKSIDRSDIRDLAIVIVLNVGAGILLNIGIRLSSAVSMSLVGNFEIVATSVIALFFGEKVSRRLWSGIIVIFIASIVLSYDASSLKVSWGIIWGLLATCLWGLENNFTKKLSVKNPIQVVIVKGLGVGIGSYLVALVAGEQAVKNWSVIGWCLVLGFFAFGLSILMYVLSQRYLGAAKTSAYYAISPFISVILSLIFLHEAVTGQFMVALVLMIIGIWIVVVDTLKA
jgi:drug/metabolite transporter (DMT)-like permease